ncbi:NADPH-dependent F420 reductase [Streptomyces sp. NPDC013161]|uniref:NADPH-dependent F420 reductase n=1 Tax=Streptomyces sp. NPDC013161 TaxID=3364862 RepID=UPI0036B3877A
MATLGLIGGGNIGGTLARPAVDTGLDVVLSNSRGPQTLSGPVTELGPRARAATPLQAAAVGDWVVVTIPVGAVGAVPREPLVGKTVIDTGNYFAPRDGTIPELEAKELTDSELLSLLGYDAVDMGPVTEGRRSQVGTPAFCAPHSVTKDDRYRSQPAAPASAAEIRAALAAARR